MWSPERSTLVLEQDARPLAGRGQAAHQRGDVVQLHQGRVAHGRLPLHRLRGVDVVACVREHALVVEGERAGLVARIVDAHRGAHDLRTLGHDRLVAV
jgi:hypothetical protein